MRRKLLVIMCLCIAGYTSVWGTASSHPSTPADAAAGPAARTDGLENLTIQRIYGEPSLLADLPSGIRWAGEADMVSYIEKRGEGDEKQSYFVVRTVPKGKEEVVCIADTVAVPEDLRKSDDTRFKIGSYSWDEDGKRVLFTFGGDVFTLERKKGRVQRVTQTEAKEQNPAFSPDGKKIAFTRDNDLYVIQLDDDKEIRLTHTGCDSVYNGILDWVYMEELFTRGNKRAFYWSPDSERLAFLEILESPVPEFPIVDWIETHADYELQRYPKAGDPNPVVRTGIAHVDNGEVVWADVDTHDAYIARIYWLGDGSRVAIEKLNRNQTELTLVFADAQTGQADVVLEETDPAWVNINYLKHYYEKKQRFIWGSERNSHQHLYLYDTDGNFIRQLTNGNWEVTGMGGVNESKGRVYFTANESNTLERQLYEVSDTGGEIRQITTGEGSHYTIMSPDNKYFIDRFTSERQPTVVSVHKVDGKKLFEIGNRMTPDLAAMDRPLPEFLKFKSAAGIEYYCSITKPSNFNRLQKYPVIVYVYGGPHAQVVRRGWSGATLWHSLMADKGYIIFSLDNRGSFGRGKRWEDHILKNLGHYELEDQLAGVEYLRSLPYVDAGRIGIWGWSYGGYMTLMALFKAPDVFKAGTAVAPVTDWRLYDSIYTERYMKLPGDNEEGYTAASPINFVDDFRGKLLLMHGDADNNVHAQNSYQLIKKLIDSGKDFDFMIYPQKAHGISGDESRVFLFNKMTMFFDRHLGGGN